MAVSISISIAQNSQNIANNTSNVTVTVKASWTYGSYNALVNANGTPQAKGWVKIDGKEYEFASTFNTGKTTSGSQTICTKTVNVSHNSNGTKTLSCSASYTTGVSSGTVTASASKELTTIPRKSTLSASNGTLAKSQTLTVTRQASSFTHTITYKCGTASGTICTKSSNTSISWTPPISLVTQNPTGSSVSVTFTITTYSGDTSVGSNTKTITCSIPGKSTLSASNGTLDKSQTLTVARNNSNYTHTITYKCGTASGTICTKSSNTSISWTPPISLASQNTTGTSVSITFTITTYYSSTSIGSSTKTINCSIPTSVAPSCTVSIAEATDCSTMYGSLVKGLSSLVVTVTATEAYGSPIDSFSVAVDGSVYNFPNQANSITFTTDVLKQTGHIPVTATVKDKRGRSGSLTYKTSFILDYSPPSISRLSVARCNQDGTANDQGAYIAATLSYLITDLNGFNSGTCYLDYKKSAESDYTRVELFDLLSALSANDYTYIFDADTGSSYDVVLTVKDRSTSSTKATSASTAFSIMHFNASGYGIGIGKVSELVDVFDIGMQTRLYGGLLYPVLESGTDFNDMRTPGFYVGENVSNDNVTYPNCPVASGTFVLEVLSMGPNGQVMQRVTVCDKNAPQVLERTYYTNAWGEWYGAWQYPSLGSKFAMYGTSISDNQPRYRKDGRLVEVRGVVTPTADIAGNTETHVIFTLPVGYRPGSPIYVICQGSGNCIWNLSVKTNGEVGFSRYRNGDTSTTCTPNTWLPFQVTYFAYCQ